MANVVIPSNVWSTVLVGCGVVPATAAKWSKSFSDNIPKAWGLVKVSSFMGQVLHECDHLKRLQEGLNYSAARLCVVWPKRFPSLEEATPYANSPPKLAEKVYGGRMGNDEPGDGAKYFGRGLIQLTGKDNYRVTGQAIGVNLLAMPDLVLEPDVGLRAAVAWWNKNIPDSILGDPQAVTKKVNGGVLGLEERISLMAKASTQLKAYYA